MEKMTEFESELKENEEAIMAEIDNLKKQLSCKDREIEQMRINEDN
jgi:hypothetical protein